MAKAFFRWLRGELNGFYLTNLYNTCNVYTEDVKKFLHDFYKMQFNLEDMSNEDIYNLGKFAGVFIPRLSAGESYGSLRMSDSHLSEGNEISERGLLNRDSETFDFIEGEFSGDINQYAISDNKSSMAGESDSVKGYISSETSDVIDENGNVKASAVSATPPTGVAYSNYYGDGFLFLSEQIVEQRNIAVTMYYELFKVMQYIRYNGNSITSLCKMVDAICPKGLVTIDSIEQSELIYSCFIVNYKYNNEVDIELKEQRLAVLKYIANLKFSQFIWQEVQE